MALAFDLNIYEWVFALLGVEATGNPVNDAVYLLLLPMIVLYLYCAFVVTMSRFGGKKISVIMMFIVGYVIIEKGFYALFAAWSLPLLILIMLYHTGSFILGWGHKKEDGTPNNITGFMQGSGKSDSSKRGFLGRMFSPALRRAGAKSREVAYNSWSQNDLKEEAGRLMMEWKRQESVVKSGHTAFGGGWTPQAQSALERQDEIEEELTSIANVNKINLDSLLSSEPRLRDAVNARKRF